MTNPKHQLMSVGVQLLGNASAWTTPLVLLQDASALQSSVGTWFTYYHLVLDFLVALHPGTAKSEVSVGVENAV